MPGHNQPGFRVVLEGQDLTDRFAPRLMSLKLTEKRGGEADQLDIEIQDTDGRMAIPAKSAVLTLELGWLSGPDVRVGMIDKGSFKVDQAEWAGPPDRIKITARSADLTAGFRQRRERTHRNTTVGEIVRRVAAANGLRAVVSDDLAGLRIEALAQDAASDMAVVRRLGERLDAVATVRSGRLLFMPNGQAMTVTGHRRAGAPPPRRSGDRYSYKRADRGQYRAVEAVWHDREGARRQTVRLEGSGGRGAGVRRLRRIYANEGDARAAASAEQNRLRRTQAEFGLTLALGRPDLIPERPVTLQGFKAEIDAWRWIVAEVDHTLTPSSGLITSLKLETR